MPSFLLLCKHSKKGNNIKNWTLERRIAVNYDLAAKSLQEKENLSFLTWWYLQ